MLISFYETWKRTPDELLECVAASKDVGATA